MLISPVSASSAYRSMAPLLQVRAFPSIHNYAYENGWRIGLTKHNSVHERKPAYRCPPSNWRANRFTQPFQVIETTWGYSAPFYSGNGRKRPF